jgi:hypothetical protein
VKRRDFLGILGVSAFGLTVHPAKAALLPPGMINAVVALGATVNTAPPGQPPKFEWVTLGTGFFYGHKVKDDPDVTKRIYELYLVTSGHFSHFRGPAAAAQSGRLGAKFLLLK